MLRGGRRTRAARRARVRARLVRELLQREHRRPALQLAREQRHRLHDARAKRDANDGVNERAGVERRDVRSEACDGPDAQSERVVGLRVRGGQFCCEHHARTTSGRRARRRREGRRDERASKRRGRHTGRRAGERRRGHGDAHAFAWRIAVRGARLARRRRRAAAHSAGAQVRVAVERWRHGREGRVGGAQEVVVQARRTRVARARVAAHVRGRAAAEPEPEPEAAERRGARAGAGAGAGPGARAGRVVERTEVERHVRALLRGERAEHVLDEARRTGHHRLPAGRLEHVRCVTASARNANACAFIMNNSKAPHCLHKRIMSAPVLFAPSCLLSADRNEIARTVPHTSTHTLHESVRTRVRLCDDAERM